MGYYEHTKERDLTKFLKGVLDAGSVSIRDDGRYELRSRISHNTPWHHVRMHPMLKCGLWHSVMFDLVSQALPPEDQFVPSHCQQCWKVVVRPQNLRQLFALLDLQKRLDLPSKCGIERRESVHGLYGGYFYNIGQPQGQACYKKIRAEVDEDPKLGPDVPVFLKRACTEYELAHPDSSSWQITDKQLALEGLIETWVVDDGILHGQPETLQKHVHTRWIEWAWAHGDPTYAEFTDGPLYPAYVTYHDKDIPC